MLLGERFKLAKEYRKSAACFDAIPTGHPRYGLNARRQAGEVFLALGNVVKAEKNLREFLNEIPAGAAQQASLVIDAKQRLRHILEVQLRFEERDRLLHEMVKAGLGDTFDAIFYCFPSLLRWNGPAAVQWCEQYLKQTPDDLNLRIALGRYRAGQGRLAEARVILMKCRREAPQNLRTVAGWLMLLREQDDWEAIRGEIAKLPPPRTSDPWLLLRIRGAEALRREDFKSAARYLEMELKQNPASPESCLGLAKAYAGQGRANDRQRMQHKATVLARIQNRLGWGQTSPKDVAPYLEIAGLCESIGLREQGLIIAKLAARFSPDDAAVRQLLSRLERKQP